VETNDDGSIDVFTTPEEFSDVKQAMLDAGLEPVNAEVTFEATTKAELDQEGAEKLMRLIDALEDLDDVQEVYSNAEIADEVMEKLEA